MKVSGFTFLRNGSLLGYPFLESINSLLLLCDEVVVAVGNSEDDTLEKVKKINNPKLKIIETTWNENMTDRGYVYAQQKMIAQFNCTGHWAFYLECDEIIHEKDIPLIRAQMAKYLNDPEVEALVFDYFHFYGTSEYIAVSPRWYKKAPRIIRNTIRSWAPDGLFWVIMHSNKRGSYPKSANVGCNIYHYGHIRKIDAMNNKTQKVERYWGKSALQFKGYGNIDPKSLANFSGTHPQIMSNWLFNNSEKKLEINQTYKLTSRDKRHRVLMFLNKLFANKLDFSKKHYKLIRK